MVGLGETPEEVETLMDDLLATGCQILTIGNTCNRVTGIIPLRHTSLRCSLRNIKL